MPTPVAAFSNSLVCEGNPTYFYDSSFVGDTLISYWLWHFGDHNAGGAVSLLEDPVHRYAEAGNYIVTLMVRDYNGCYDTVDSTITVNPSPVSAFSLEEDLGGKPGRLQLYNHLGGGGVFLLGLWKRPDIRRREPGSDLLGGRNVYDHTHYGK
ncbi:MAG: PKD domain-containing protein [Marinilabiliales bacterium]|nr:PKD domain-containing protein [Marinilabiliales bacterium]